MTAIKNPSRVQSVTFLTPEAFVLRFERKDLAFQPGQYLSVGLAGHREQREYSIFSPVDQPWLEILVKIVNGGKVSRELACLQPGDELSVDGPFGYFLVEPEQRPLPFLFVATGTGLSPFRCFVRSYPGLDYKLLHGVRTGCEQYSYDEFERARLVSCVSRDSKGDYEGRVTGYLKDQEIDQKTQVYLCGNCDMIYEVFDLLKAKGIGSSQIFTEVYF